MIGFFIKFSVDDVVDEVGSFESVIIDDEVFVCGNGCCFFFYW